MNCPYIIISFSALIRVIRGIRVLFFIFWNFGVILYHRAHVMCPYGFKIRLISSILFILIPTVFSHNWANMQIRPYTIIFLHSRPFVLIRGQIFSIIFISIHQKGADISSAPHYCNYIIILCYKLLPYLLKLQVLHI